MKKRTLLNLDLQEELVEEKDVLAKLKLGYKIPIQLAYLFNKSTKDVKHIKTEYKSSQQKIIHYLENGYEFVTSKKLLAIKNGFAEDLVGSEKTEPVLEIDKVAELEKEILRKKEEFEIFRQLSQINVKVSKDLHEENEALKAQIDKLTREKPVANNFIAQHLLEILSSNPLEEVVLSNKGGVITFSGVVKVKNK